MKLKVGDFLCRVDGEIFEIAFVKSLEKDYYSLHIMKSTGIQYEYNNIEKWEIEADEWVRLNTGFIKMLLSN